MTVTRTPIVLWLEQAPSDRFDDDSEPRFRVVAALGQGAARRHIVPLTREHTSEAEAMSVLSDKILRPHAPMLTFTSPVTLSATEADALTAAMGVTPTVSAPEPCADMTPEPEQRKRWRR